MSLLNHFIELFAASAPWLLLGLLIAGLMQWLVPLPFLQKQLGKDDLLSVIKAALIGAPLPLCSCGVIPAAVGLRRGGASKPATIAFLVATPETGVDSISVSYALLGPFMAIIRPVFAIISAIYAGTLVKLVEFIGARKSIAQGDQEATNGPLNQALAHEADPAVKSCCAKQAEKSQPPVEVVTKSCCHEKQPEQQRIGITQRLLDAVKFASGKLLQDITLWLLIGLVVAAAIKTWLPEAFLTSQGNGLMAMLVMALIGIPMYICATSSTPMAAGLMAAGVSPGAVLVFMLAGPATNLSTMGMIRRELGKTVLFSYLFSILTASIGFGYLTNMLVEQFQFQVYSLAAHNHSMSLSIVHQLSAVLLFGLMIRNWLLQRSPKLTGHSAT